MFKRQFFPIFAALVVAFSAGSANAWYVEVTNVDGTLTSGEMYTMDVIFNTDNPELNLNDLFVNVQYDTSKLSYLGVTYDTWYLPLSATAVWYNTGSPTGHDAATGMIDTISGMEPFDDPGTYFPGATASSTVFGAGVTPANHIATLYFSALDSGDFTDLANFAWHDIFTMQVTLDDNTTIYRDPDLVIGKEGTSAILSAGSPSAVPVPGTAVLLAFGMAGLLGLRRRRA